MKIKKMYVKNLMEDLGYEENVYWLLDKSLYDNGRYIGEIRIENDYNVKPVLITTSPDALTIMGENLDDLGKYTV